jgi:hypothetical protein
MREIEKFAAIPTVKELLPKCKKCLDESVGSTGVGRRRFASLEWLKKLKLAAGRPRDCIDLENLP